MQILAKTLNFDGMEEENTIIAVRCTGVVVVIENRGPAAIDIANVGKLNPNRFMVLGELEEIALAPPGQFTTIDVSAYITR